MVVMVLMMSLLLVVLVRDVGCMMWVRGRVDVVWLVMMAVVVGSGGECWYESLLMLCMASVAGMVMISVMRCWSMAQLVVAQGILD